MTFEDIRRRIEIEYVAGGYGLGWRLLASPISCLNECRVAFIGLNPGGNEDTGHARLAMDVGSAYVEERWAGYAPGQSPLQRQVQRLFRNLEVEPPHVLAGNLVPFRSPDWAALPNKTRALAFGNTIWTELLRRAEPELIVTMGGTVFESLAAQLGLTRMKRVASGWGQVAIRYGEADGRKMVGLPHLSRFALLGRPESERPLKMAFGGFWKGELR
ncbi:uracil-DNA glycosylase family protein [Devosia honganensis]|uniref:Uracil-DNA glycosylase family protein n=1 Tax=Devosia honganensis TaxID=1610527 RepID=A0ABV7WVM5_9HYPH